MSDEPAAPTRRGLLALFSSLGLSATLLPGVLWTKLQESGTKRVTVGMLEDAAALAGLDLSGAQLDAIVEEIEENLERYEGIRQADLPNDVPLPLHFDPRVPGVEIEREKRGFRRSDPPDVSRPADLEEVAHWPVLHLAELLRTGRVRATELTEIYLGRLKRYGPRLECVVNLTEDRARRQAERADAEIASGRYRGPLHGIPWGVKDIVAVEGYPTTWGAAPFEDRVIDVDATVVERLSEAGAVLVAKLTSGELAFGDRWFGGRTRNPWKLDEGSSGSSAGSAAATAAGLVGFAIGTDTGGSILSPAERCGIVGLRPTFGRVSRHGVMNAGFTLDKVGPMCRTAEGCAVVLDAVAGPDGRDLAVARDVPLSWDAGLDVGELEVGYYATGFENETDREYRANARTALDTIRTLAADLRPVAPPESDLTYFIEFVERAAGFQRFVRRGLDAGLRRQAHRAELRAYQLVPGVEYLQANRLRRLHMEEMARIMEEVDVIVSPRTSLDPKQSLNPLTSMTGHPVVAVPHGFESGGTPTGFELVGRIYREGELLALAKAFQDATGLHRRHPTLEPGP